MKRIVFTLTLFCTIFVATELVAQTNTYNTSGSEIIFSWGDLQYTDEFLQAYPQAQIVNHPVRFTVFFHIQQFWHLDFGNNVGFFTGIGLRNIGQISDEYLPGEMSDVYNGNNPYAGGYFNAKVIRRTYSLGIPLAIKLGSFKDHLHVYAGGEMEWSFHMKEKWWNSHSRSGSKTKSTAWWPEQITTFLPSAFVGVQFPGGVNLKFKYYLENFLNHDHRSFEGSTTINGNQRHDLVVSDLRKYEQSTLFYISVSFQFKTAKLMQRESSGSVASLY